MACCLAGAVHAVESTSDWHVAVVLSFDMDAETVWWTDPDSMTGNPSSLAQGRYGPNVALPAILDVLKSHDVRATFFIPAWVIENYPAAVASIVASGHEIGAHGVRHESPANLSPVEEQQVLDRSIDVIRQATGRPPAGYRAPSWAFSDVTLGLVVDAGFLYSSNLMDRDQPYVHEDSNGLVELPVSWVLDDAPFFWFDEQTWNKKIHSAAEVETIWKEEFAAVHESGGYFGLTMHPQIIGRPGRLRMLDRLIGWMKDHESVRFMTGEELAENIRGSEK